LRYLLVCLAYVKGYNMVSQIFSLVI